MSSLYHCVYMWATTDQSGAIEDEALSVYKIGTTPNGEEWGVISALPHEIVFEDGTKVPAGLPRFAEFLKATANETERFEKVPKYVYSLGGDVANSQDSHAAEPDDEISFVSRRYGFSAEVLASLKFMYMRNQEKGIKVSIMTSSIGIEAGCGTRFDSTVPLFVAPTTTDETCRLPNDQKRCYKSKWCV